MEPGFPQTGTADSLYERIKDMTACRGTPSLHSCGEASKIVQLELKIGEEIPCVWS